MVSTLNRKITAAAAAAFCIIAPVIIPPAPVAAQTQVRTGIDSLASIWWTGEEAALTGISRGTVDFRSSAQNVQGRLQLRLTLVDIDGRSLALPEVPRASIRFRFPITEDYTFRVTSGRDRLSWGVGSLYNAGDLLFGADGRSSADLTRSDDVRDETAWLLSGYFPMGELGYLETVALPSLPQLSIGSLTEQSPNDGAASSPAPSLSTVRAGLRIYSTFGPFSLEPAYLFNGQSERHHLAVSMQGTAFGADIYTASSLTVPAVPGDVPGIDDLLHENARISAGVFRGFTIGYDQNLTGRLEALVEPGKEWKKTDAGPEQTITGYALQLYPEFIWTPNRTVSVIGRAIVSPIDASAEITAGATWNIFQGFSALAFAAARVGDSTSVYSWDSDGSLSLSAGFRYHF
ncbi:MAG: hypothetical protein ACOC0D_01475 [Spirochaeta sp.]